MILFNRISNFSWFGGSVMCDVSLVLRSKVGLVNYLGSIVLSSVIRRSKMPAPKTVMIIVY